MMNIHRILLNALYLWFSIFLLAACEEAGISSAKARGTVLADELADERIAEDSTIDSSNKERNSTIVRSEGKKHLIIYRGVKDIAPDTFGSARLTDITIPNTVVTIGDDAFFGNKLKTVTIPDSVVIIGLWAFQYNQLKEVIIPDSIKGLGYLAFGNNQLTSITIPASLSLSGRSAFHNNPKLQDVRLAGDTDGLTLAGRTYRYSNLERYSITVLTENGESRMIVFRGVNVPDHTYDWLVNILRPDELVIPGAIGARFDPLTYVPEDTGTRYSPNPKPTRLINPD